MTFKSGSMFQGVGAGVETHINQKHMKICFLWMKSCFPFLPPQKPLWKTNVLRGMLYEVMVGHPSVISVMGYSPYQSACQFLSINNTKQYYPCTQSLGVLRDLQTQEHISFEPAGNLNIYGSKSRNSF